MRPRSYILLLASNSQKFPTKSLKLKACKAAYHPKKSLQTRKVYKHSHFNPDAFGHGGNKRTAQIDELLINAGITTHNVSFENTALIKNKLPTYLAGFKHDKTKSNSHKNRYAIGRYLKLFETFVEEQKPEFFIWESTVGYNLLLAEVLYKKNIPVIALPHNIESLVAGAKSPFTNKTSPDWLLEELKYLGYCENTFTISREEQWLLSAAGINSQYLPYYPPHQTKSYLLEIRERKYKLQTRVSKSKNILLLGTFHNKPTFEGYVTLIKNIKHSKDIIINVAGFGSEKLNDMFIDTNVKIWGSVTNDQLTELIVNADMGVVYQEASSGALTRVPELLIAGLPLLLNTHAARSCYDMQGIRVYNSFDELLELLHEAPVPIPTVLNQPVEEKIFVNYLKEKINQAI